jgi:hypothetical protein
VGWGGVGRVVTMKPALTEKSQMAKQSASMQNSIYVTRSRLVTKFSTSEKKLPVPETIPMQFRVAPLDTRYSNKAFLTELFN